MKKVTLILGVLLGLIFLIGCTDESKELEERNEFELQQQAIEKEEIEEPDDRNE